MNNGPNLIQGGGDWTNVIIPGDAQNQKFIELSFHHYPSTAESPESNKGSLFSVPKCAAGLISLPITGKV